MLYKKQLTSVVYDRVSYNVCLENKTFIFRMFRIPTDVNMFDIFAIRFEKCIVNDANNG